MINKVDTSRVCESHLPSTRKRSKLRNGLLLNLTVGIVLSAIKANILLAARVDPSCCSSVMVNKIRSALWSPALFPTRRKLASSRAGGTGVKHLCSVASGRRIVRRRAAATLRSAGGLQGRRAGASAVLWKSSILVSLSFDLSVHFSLVAGLTGAGHCRSVPAGRTSIMVDIIGSSKVVLTPLPSRRQAALGIFKRAKLAGRAWLGNSICRCRGATCAGGMWWSIRRSQIASIRRRHGRAGSTVGGRR